MKAAFFGFVFVAATLLAPPVAADTDQVNGTWSGSWIPAGGVRDAVTVEIRLDGEGQLTGRFLTPARMDFSKASFDPATRTIVLEAVDEKAGKHYKIEGQIEGTELKGTLGASDVSGDLRLIKWTYVPRTTWR